MSSPPLQTGMIPYLDGTVHHLANDARDARERYYRHAQAEIDEIERELRGLGRRVSLAEVRRILHERGARAPHGGPLTDAHIKRFRERGRRELPTTKGVPQMQTVWRTFPTPTGTERRRVRVAVGNSSRRSTRKEL